MPDIHQRSTRQSLPLRLKFAGSAPEGSFTGYASTFNGAPDCYGDVISPGAFAATLATHAKRGTLPALLWAHDMQQPIGRLTDLREDEKGLAVRGELTLEVARAKEAHALMVADALAFSIGYLIPDGGMKYLDGGDRLLTRIDLVEISLVAVPANYEARVTGVKGIGILKKALREHGGLSSREADFTARKVWPELFGPMDLESEQSDADRSAADLVRLAHERNQATERALERLRKESAQKMTSEIFTLADELARTAREAAAQLER